MADEAGLKARGRLAWHLHAPLPEGATDGVRLLRRAGVYLEQQAGRCRNRLVKIGAVGLTASGVVGFLADPTSAWCGLALTGAVAGPTYARLTALRKGIRGEQLVTT